MQTITGRSGKVYKILTQMRSFRSWDEQGKEYDKEYMNIKLRDENDAPCGDGNIYQPFSGVKVMEEAQRIVQWFEWAKAHPRENMAMHSAWD